MKRTLLSLVSVGLVVAACGTTARAVGQPCVVDGVTVGECETGAVCSKDGNDTLTCLKICDFGSTVDGGTDAAPVVVDAGASCTSDQECTAVTNSTVKACRNKKSASDAATSG